MVGTEEIIISEAEAALYDRQIRLWGLDAQKRLRGSRVLLVGLTGLGAEVAKNLTLSGIKSLTLLDHRVARKGSANFLVPESSIGKNVAEASSERVQRLNPMVQILVDTDDISTKSEEFFGEFDVVCTTCISTEEAYRINAVCRKHSVPFYFGDTFGFVGFFFVDLIEHEFAEDVSIPVVSKDDGSPSKKSKTELTETKTVKKTVDYVSYQTAFESDISHIPKRNWRRIKEHVIMMKTLMIFRSQMNRDPEASSRDSDLSKLYEIRDHVLHEMKIEEQIVKNASFNVTFGEMSPSAAVLGGVLAQEVIKAVSHKDVPIRNFFFFNGATDCSGLVEAIGF